MKLNWGFGIFAFYTAFVVFILFLVFRSSQEQVDLVTEDYYEQELDYQNIIRKKNNALALDPGLTYTINKMEIALSFPSDQSLIAGDIKIYRASNKNFDKDFKIELDSENKMELNLDQSPLGLYKMMVSWEANDVGYFVEKDIYLTP
jgi:hypothetical protein